MHRTIEMAVPPARTDALVQELEELDAVVSLSVMRGASVKPPGDVVTVHAINRGADAVLVLADAAREAGHVSVATAELSSIADPKHERKVANDVDEALWEEIETDLRHQSRVTSNYLVLMAVGGAVAATAFMEEATPQTVSLVAASIIAPGFEPLAKIPMGLALRRWSVAGRGLLSASIGYVVLALSAALVFLALNAVGVATTQGFAGNSEVASLAEPTTREVLVSACGAVAGMIMLLSHRRYVIPGALIALGVISAAAMSGIALATGDLALAYEGLKRFTLDVLLIIVFGTLLVLLKQAFVHRRRPMI